MADPIENGRKKDDDKLDMIDTRLVAPEIFEQFSAMPYPLEQVNEEVLAALASIPDLPDAAIEAVAIKPTPPDSQADRGFHCGPLAKILRKNPVAIATELSQKLPILDDGLVLEYVVEGPYLNFKIDHTRFAQTVAGQVFEMGADYGKENIGNGSRIILDMSAPNTAKPFSVGHLRSTVIGDSLANIKRHLGYEVIRDNHLGDWGTQFGHLLYAIEQWGDLDEIATDPIMKLKELYVKANAYGNPKSDIYSGVPIAEAEKEAEIVKNAGRAWFKRLEEGDERARELWQLTADWSLAEFQRIYDILKVDFEWVRGESYYEDMLPATIQRVVDSGITTISNGALIVDLRTKAETVRETSRSWFEHLGDNGRHVGDQEKDMWQQISKLSLAELQVMYDILVNDLGWDKDTWLDQEILESALRSVMDIDSNILSEVEIEDQLGLGVAIIQKADGATVYLTREIATALDRAEVESADGMIYVVGADQKFYFRQFFEILKRMGLGIADQSEHVYFGMISMPAEDGEKSQKMSTREGRTILLEDVINEAVERTRTLMKDRTRISGEEKENVVKQVAVGALKWNDLMADPRRDIVFDWDNMLSMEGDSAPYVQYTYARAKSLTETVDPDMLREQNINAQDPLEQQLMLKIAELSQVVQDASQVNNPSKVANYVYELAKLYSSFYNQLPVLRGVDEETKMSRLAISEVTARTIEIGLNLLGIEAPKRM